jgi:hypothetical protein
MKDRKREKKAVFGVSRPPREGWPAFLRSSPVGRARERYQKYLHSEQWQEKRAAVLKRDGYFCVGCSAQRFLDVHHLTYDRWGSERLEDLATLCRECHMLEHRKEIPVIVITEDEIQKRKTVARKMRYDRAIAATQVQPEAPRVFKRVKRSLP